MRKHLAGSSRRRPPWTRASGRNRPPGRQAGEPPPRRAERGPRGRLRHRPHRRRIRRGLTVAGTVLGTAGYLSPEQARGEPATHASDIYGLGVVAYELLTAAGPSKALVPERQRAHIHQPSRRLGDAESVCTFRRPRPRTCPRQGRCASLPKRPRARRGSPRIARAGRRADANSHRPGSVLPQPHSTERGRSTVPILLGTLALAALAGAASWPQS